MSQINNIVEGLNSLLKSSSLGSLGTSLLFLALTGSMCYVGYKFLRFYVAMAGGYLGLIIGYAMAIALTVTDQRSATWGLVLGFGIAFFFIGFFLEKAGNFAMMAFLTFALGRTVLSSYLSGAWLLVVSFMAACFVGALAMQFLKSIVIVLFPLAGGFAFASYVVRRILPMVGSINNESLLTTAIFIIGIGMAVSGFITQMNAK